MGVSALVLPSNVAGVTLYSDGWISILVAGIFSLILGLLALKVAETFPGQSFLSYASYLVTKPIAVFIMIIYILICIFSSGYIIRSVSQISQRYLFQDTPLEVLSLTFLLVVVYAISSERVGVFRLNIMFLPIILLVFVFVGLFNIRWMEMDNFLPLFKSDISGYVNGALEAFKAYAGYGIALFYFSIIRQPKKMAIKTIIALSVPTIFYIMIFLLTIGIFGNEVTANLTNPTIEMAKRVDIPGGIFERIDAFVFTIWIMAIFNTVSIVLDLCLLLICSLFPKFNKKKVAFILAPIVYYICMFPQQLQQGKMMGDVISYFHVFFTATIIIVLFLLAKIRGGKRKNA